jgi:hypothetical protein
MSGKSDRFVGLRRRRAGRDSIAGNLTATMESSCSRCLSRNSEIKSHSIFFREHDEDLFEKTMSVD